MANQVASTPDNASIARSNAANAVSVVQLRAEVERLSDAVIRLQVIVDMIRKRLRV